MSLGNVFNRTLNDRDSIKATSADLEGAPWKIQGLCLLFTSMKCTQKSSGLYSSMMAEKRWLWPQPKQNQAVQEDQ